MKEKKRWPRRLEDLFWAAALGAAVLFLLFFVLWLLSGLIFLGGFR